MPFTSAIVRIPGSNFADGLTSVDLGKPILETALRQHGCYCDALRRCGLTVAELNADLRYPDSTFVEDTAILTPKGAILTRPGAASRAGEVSAIREAIALFYGESAEIEAPGTLDGGDICEADDHFFIGLSHRTNEEGARQLARHLRRLGYTSSVIDAREIPGILHLKSGISYIGDGTLAAIPAMARDELFRNYRVIQVSAKESYAANCVRVNERVLVAAGYPEFTGELERLGFRPMAVEMSEFEKMDGGPSCLSLRF